MCLYCVYIFCLYKYTHSIYKKNMYMYLHVYIYIHINTDKYI